LLGITLARKKPKKSHLSLIYVPEGIARLQPKTLRIILIMFSEDVFQYLTEKDKTRGQPLGMDNVKQR